MSAHIINMIASAGTVENITQILRHQSPETAYEVLRQASVQIEQTLETNIREKQHITAMLNLSKLAAMDDMLLLAERRMIPSLGIHI